LLEAVRLHLDDAVSVYRGRTELRSEVDADDYRLGLPPGVDERFPDRPVDGLGEVVSGED
jgi:formyltetrahydrofolate deformylase